jgi:hypothetical protein
VGALEVKFMRSRSGSKGRRSCDAECDFNTVNENARWGEGQIGCPVFS